MEGVRRPEDILYATTQSLCLPVSPPPLHAMPFLCTHREKDMAKAMAHQDKQLTRIRQWYGYGSGPPDDLDLEWERLTTAAGFSETDQVIEAPEPGSAPPPAGTPGGVQVSVLARPPFPPTSLGLQPAFPPELGDELGSEVLSVWNFLYSFSDVLGMSPPPLDELLHALVEGRGSGVLPLIHVALLRLLQADMEEAYAAGAAMVRGRFLCCLHD